MSKISLEDYEKIEKINFEQQKAIQENAKAVAMKERLSQCSIVELEGGGHWLYQEAPGSFESATRWFFQKHGLV